MFQHCLISEHRATPVRVTPMGVISGEAVARGRIGCFISYFNKTIKLFIRPNILKCQMKYIRSVYVPPTSENDGLRSAFLLMRVTPAIVRPFQSILTNQSTNRPAGVSPRTDRYLSQFLQDQSNCKCLGLCTVFIHRFAAVLRVN